MPLRQLADELLRLSEHHRSIPVLVTPDYISLRRRFFVELVITLAETCHRPIRIDWYRNVPSVWSLVSDQVAAVRVARTNTALDALMSRYQVSARMRITGVLPRPGDVMRDDVDRELVIGWCDETRKLPPWATAVRLGATPKGSLPLQSSAA